MSDNLVGQLGREAAKAAPPVVVTAYSLISRGLPFVISVLTLVYLSVQITYLVWRFVCDVQAKRRIEAAMGGPVAKYEPRIPK